MRKFLSLLLIAFAMCANGIAQLKEPTASITGNLNNYEYFYVVPTSGVTSSSSVSGGYGGATKTIVPSETINGYLMQKGYNTISSIVPEFASKTLIVSYGYTGRRSIPFLSYASCIIIQMRDASSQDLIATFEAEGCGADETDDILEAIYLAMNMFRYCRDPQIVTEVNKIYKGSLFLSFKNNTPTIINHITLRLTYLLDGVKMHEQTTQINTLIHPGYYDVKRVKRDKQAQNKKYTINAEVISYE